MEGSNNSDIPGTNIKTKASLKISIPLFKGFDKGGSNFSRTATAVTISTPTPLSPLLQAPLHTSGNVSQAQKVVPLSNVPAIENIVGYSSTEQAILDKPVNSLSHVITPKKESFIDIGIDTSTPKDSGSKCS
jgi:hypothetical protein